MADRIIISGEPGTTFTNDTGRVLYQFIAALNNTCGVCLQYHLKISNAWPIPIHYGCRCIQRLVKPGQTAPHEFTDYRKLLEEMDDADKRAAIGASNYRLLKSGLATWEDIVTPNRVRDFREVVAKKNLTVKQMTDHGVKRVFAEKAYSAVHTAEHEHVERQRRELLDRLTGAGLSQEKIVGELSSRLAARVTIGPGPTGPYTTGPAWSGGPLPGTGPSTAAELAGLLGAWKPKRQRAAMPKAPAVQATPVAVPPPKPAEEPGQFTHVKHVEKWASTVFPNADVDLTGIPLESWNHITQELASLAKKWPEVAANLKQFGTHGEMWRESDLKRGFAIADPITGRFLSFNPAQWGSISQATDKVSSASKNGWMAKGVTDPNYVIAHEWGHLVAANLRTADRQKWGALHTVFSDDPSQADWNKAKQVSKYALTNRDEAFAESFAALRYQPPGLHPPVVKAFKALLK